jgi:hypothetical protein
MVREPPDSGQIVGWIEDQYIKEYSITPWAPFPNSSIPKLEGGFLLEMIDQRQY